MFGRFKIVLIPIDSNPSETSSLTNVSSVLGDRIQQFRKRLKRASRTIIASYHSTPSLLHNLWDATRCAFAMCVAVFLGKPWEMKSAFGCGCGNFFINLALPLFFCSVWNWGTRNVMELNQVRTRNDAVFCFVPDSGKRLGQPFLWGRVV